MCMSFAAEMATYLPVTDCIRLCDLFLNHDEEGNIVTWDWAPTLIGYVMTINKDLLEVVQNCLLSVQNFPWAQHLQPIWLKPGPLTRVEKAHIGEICIEMQISIETQAWNKVYMNKLLANDAFDYIY